MIVGAYGDTVFEVSNRKVNTFSDFKREYKAKFAEHERIQQEPVLEYLHRDLESISFTMTLLRDLGTDPTAELNKLKELMYTGEADYLIFGNAPVGENAWVIESMSEAVNYFDKDMNVISSKVDVRMKECVLDDGS